MRCSFLAGLCLVLRVQAQPGGAPPAAPITVRVATFNVEDLRTEELMSPDTARPRRLAEVIQRVRPNIILINEIAYDTPGAPGVAENEPEGRNGQRFADNFLAAPQATNTAPLRYRAFMAPTNTGIPSGLDLDKDGAAVKTYPVPPRRPAEGSPPEPPEDARRYGNDCWGFGTFPGQYGMALLVDERLTVLSDQVRTFRLLPWDYMPGAFLPEKPDHTDWFTPEEKAVVRLSSKSHWDVPVKFPNGAVVHFLCSHPTPPVFDGPEKRNARRNHDEIRFWSDYIDGASYIVDDNDHGGGLEHGALFVILGDLNADPVRGESLKRPVATLLETNSRIDMKCVPSSDLALPGLAPADTASFKLRVDYVLPATDLSISRCGVWRQPPSGNAPFPSDHFLVWAELAVPAR